MALWKKILIWLSVIVGFMIVIMLVLYFYIKNLEFETAPTGDYVLTKISKIENGEAVVVEEFTDKTYYITINDNNEVTSFSADKGIIEKDAGYFSVLIGEEFLLYNNDEEGSLAYSGVYKNGTIRIEKTTQEGTYLYYYTQETFS